MVVVFLIGPLVVVVHRLSVLDFLSTTRDSCPVKSVPRREAPYTEPVVSGPTSIEESGGRRPTGTRPTFGALEYVAETKGQNTGTSPINV